MSRRYERSEEPDVSVEVPGLSVVELVLALEETFGLRIPDRDADALVTVGDLKKYLATRVAQGLSTDCATQRAFYRLRRIVCAELGLAPINIRPRTRWKDLLPAKGRRGAWKRIVKRAGLPNKPRCDLPILRWNLPAVRNTIGKTAQLLASSDMSHPRADGDGWTRDEISRTVDRLVVDICEVTDFADNVRLVD